MWYYFQNNFSRWHLGVFLVIWLLFTALTFYIVVRGLDDAAQHLDVVALTTAGTLLGPMTGAISRGCQGCCLQFSLSLLPFCGGALAVASVLQVLRLPPVGWVKAVRLLLWTLGLIAWFLGGLISFGHALS